MAQPQQSQQPQQAQSWRLQLEQQLQREQLQREQREQLEEELLQAERHGDESTILAVKERQMKRVQQIWLDRIAGLGPEDVLREAGYLVDEIETLSIGCEDLEAENDDYDEQYMTSMQTIGRLERRNKELEEEVKQNDNTELLKENLELMRKIEMLESKMAATTLQPAVGAKRRRIDED